MVAVAKIQLTDQSTIQSVTIDDVKHALAHYIEQVGRTGAQLQWDYAAAAFPYTMHMKPEGENVWFYLKGTQEMYRTIVIGVGHGGETQDAYIQVVLPDGHTHGDKAKGNELCRFLAKRFRAKLTLFNGRTMTYYPRK
jgi:hypothetical protein